jgi:peptidoglycan hydrolase CwlO-like protein
MEELQKSVKKLEEEKENSEKQLDSLDNVPEKFADIKNPEAYAAQLQDEIDDCETNLDKHNDLLREAERKLGEKSAEE